MENGLLLFSHTHHCTEKKPLSIHHVLSAKPGGPISATAEALANNPSPWEPILVAVQPRVKSEFSPRADHHHFLLLLQNKFIG